MEKKDKSKSIELRLLKIQETAFFIDSTELSSLKKSKDDKFNIDFSFKVEFNLEKNIFILHFSVKYTHDSDNEHKKVLELITANHFHINNLKEHVSVVNDRFEDNAGIMPMLVNIAIGTIRGILIVKTAGTILSDFPLPIVNSQEVCMSLMNGGKHQ